MKKYFFLFAISIITALGSVTAFANDAKETDSETHTLTLRRIENEAKEGGYYWEIETEQGQLEEGRAVIGMGAIPLDFYDEIDTFFAFNYDDINMEFLDGKYGLTKEMLLDDDFESAEIEYTMDDVYACGGYTDADMPDYSNKEEKLNQKQRVISHLLWLLTMETQQMLKLKMMNI